MASRITLLLLTFACHVATLALQSQADEPPELTSQLAKEALLRMMRSPTGQKERLFQGDVPDKVEKMKITEGEKGWYQWTAAFRIHPADAKYELTVMPNPGVRACMYQYAGSFEYKNGQWVAVDYKLVFSAMLTGEVIISEPKPKN